MPTPWTLDNRVAIVTGGSRGIGYAIADAMLSRGARDVIVTVRKPVTLADNEKFRTRDNRAFLELCRHGGIVVSPTLDHERDFLRQVERSVQVCLGQLSF